MIAFRQLKQQHLHQQQLIEHQQQQQLTQWPPRIFIIIIINRTKMIIQVITGNQLRHRDTITQFII